VTRKQEKLYAIKFRDNAIESVQDITDQWKKRTENEIKQAADILIWARSVEEAIEKASKRQGVSWEPPRLFGITDISEKLGWSKQRVHVYWKRGKLPEPATHIGGRPAWTAFQVEQIKKKIEKNKK